MPLARYSSAAFSTASGVAVAGNSTVAVRVESSGSLATIYSDREGTTPLTNPLTADSEGRFSFFAVGVDEGYKIDVTFGAESYSLRNVAIGTASECDATVYTRTLLAADDAADARSTLSVYSQAETQALLSTANLTEDTSPALGSDYVRVLKSGSPTTERRVLLGRLGGGVLGTPQATTSGTAIDFTSIPSWAKKVTVFLDDVSTNGTDALLIQIGDSGGIEPTGYDSVAIVAQAGSALGGGTSTAGFILQNAIAAADPMSGAITIELGDAANNNWFCSGLQHRTSGANQIHFASGKKSLSATLDRVRLTTTSGTNTFDAGSVAIKYE
jgi:hypothetical protein